MTRAIKVEGMPQDLAQSPPPCRRFDSDHQAVLLGVADLQRLSYGNVA